MARLFRMHAGKKERITVAAAGDIVAARGIRFARTGDTLCDPGAPIVYESIEIRKPVVSVVVEPRTVREMDRLRELLCAMVDEDPTLSFRDDAETGQILLSGMGELHLEITIDRLAREHGMEVRKGNPQVVYRETVASVGSAESVFEREIAERQVKVVTVVGVSPAPRGSGVSTRAPVAKTPARAKENVAKPSEPALAPNEPIGMTLSPEGSSTEDSEPATGGPVAAVPPSPPSAQAPPSAPAAAAPAATNAPAAREPAPAAPAAVDEDWKREVAQDRAVASTTGAPERAQYIKSLEGLEHGDCSKAIPGLKSVSAGSKGSPLTDNAIYWQARCLAARGDDRKAVSRLNEVVSRYPKSDKAPAALWEQGQLQLRSGNTSAARGTFARLVRDYPASAEAGRARRKLVEIAN